jgi:hypothetical protein
MCDVVVFVNHSKKKYCSIVLVEFDHLWVEMKSLFELWKDDCVEVMHEKQDFQKLRYLANNENYSHTLGSVFN